MNNYFMTPQQWLDKACTDLGLEDEHTVAIARIVEIYKTGGAKCWDAAIVCRAIYMQGLGAYHMVED